MLMHAELIYMQLIVIYAHVNIHEILCMEANWLFFRKYRVQSFIANDFPKPTHL